MLSITDMTYKCKLTFTALNILLSRNVFNQAWST